MIDKIRVENAVIEILYAIGEDPNREGLLETPKRVANMYEEIYGGLTKDPMDEIKLFSEENNGEMVVIKDIPFYSTCEHHLLPFYGKVNIVYIPSDRKVIGISKFARIVDCLAHRPQIQEKLTNEIADVIYNATGSVGVGVIITAEHLCMNMRGIKKPGSKTVTSVFKGQLKNDSKTRLEAMELIKLQ